MRGRVVTADARHTQTAFAQGVLDQGGAYLLCGNGKQPPLYADIALAFADPATPTSNPTVTIDRHRGRTAVRRLRTTTAPHDDLTTWPGVAQVAALARTVPAAKGTHQDVVFLLTRCPPTRAQRRQLLAWIRGHWSVEARHGVRDLTFGEDRSRLRGGHTPQTRATVRNLCLTLIRRTATTALAAKRRSFANHPARALALLLPKQRAA